MVGPRFGEEDLGIVEEVVAHDGQTHGERPAVGPWARRAMAEVRPPPRQISKRPSSSTMRRPGAREGSFDSAPSALRSECGLAPTGAAALACAVISSKWAFTRSIAASSMCQASSAFAARLSSSKVPSARAKSPRRAKGNALAAGQKHVVDAQLLEAVRIGVRPRRGHPLPGSKHAGAGHPESAQLRHQRFQPARLSYLHLAREKKQHLCLRIAQGGHGQRLAEELAGAVLDGEASLVGVGHHAAGQHVHAPAEKKRRHDHTGPHEHRRGVRR